MVNISFLFMLIINILGGRIHTIKKYAEGK